MLTFDPHTHTYAEDGRKIPGVTSVLQGAGLIDFSKIPESIRQAALNRGLVVHKVCELDAANNLNEASVHPDVKGYLSAFRKFRSEKIKEVVGTERRLVSKKYHYAGTADLLAITIEDKLTVVDYKTSVDFSPANDIQLAAYFQMEKEAGNKPQERLTVLLNNDGGYKLFRPKNSFAHDLNIFLAALSIKNWREIYL